MEVNKEKCHVMHFGNSNNEWTYTLEGEALSVVEEEKDLGIIIHKSGKPHAQCLRAAKKSNQVLGQLCRNVISKDKRTFTTLYKTYVRPHLEYAVQAWNPWNASDIDLLERVQRRATRQIPGIGKKAYEERLKILGLTSLYERRRRGDMIELHKIINGETNVQRSLLFKSVHKNSQAHHTRGNTNQNLFKHHVNLEIRKNFFTQRVINNWNNLPLSLKNATSTLDFKKNYDKHGSGEE
jgi:transcriptional regulator of acetoin/glycerol metabolism